MGETLSYGIAWFSTAVVLLHMPYGYIRIALKEKRELKEENEFTKAYGYLIDGIRVDSIS